MSCNSWIGLRTTYMKYEDIERLLDTYSLTEILELNELTETDVLYHLINSNYIKVPEPVPVDLINE